MAELTNEKRFGEWPIPEPLGSDQGQGEGPYRWANERILGPTIFDSENLAWLVKHGAVYNLNAAYLAGHKDGHDSAHADAGLEIAKAERRAYERGQADKELDFETRLAAALTDYLTATNEPIKKDN